MAAAGRIFSFIAAKTPQNLLPGDNKGHICDYPQKSLEKRTYFNTALTRSHVFMHNRLSPLHMSSEVSRKLYPSPILFSRNYIRGHQSTAGATTQPIENPVMPVPKTNQTSSIAQQVNSKLISSEKQDHAMIFFCKSCNVRSVKIVCRDSYDKGVVIARCDGCNDLHLLVDRLGLVGEHASIEEFLAAHGQDVEKNSVDALNLMLDEKVKSNLKASVKQDHAMIFSCKSCNARSTKIVCRDSYDKGVVVARCDSCNELHLIVDRLGMVGEHSSIEEFLAAHGQDVEKNSVDALNLMLLDDHSAAAAGCEEEKDSSVDEDSDSDSTSEEDEDSSSEEDNDSAGGEDKHPAAKEDE
ncbi:hypothetical protein CASFOL_006408 [Castilleja foliolosa]|uniref:DNL-type domain-containing protein n=1 Tax=Castilleja foliolosa TaxID=1961234 RepID=A0ABD3EA71_9LAMI